MYGASLIKKKKYWPKGVPGVAIDAHFEDKYLNHFIFLRHQLMSYLSKLFFERTKLCDEDNVQVDDFGRP